MISALEIDFCFNINSSHNVCILLIIQFRGFSYENYSLSNLRGRWIARQAGIILPYYTLTIDQTIRTKSTQPYLAHFNLINHAH